MHAYKVFNNSLAKLHKYFVNTKECSLIES